MRILVLGARGYLGSAFLKAIPGAMASTVDIADPNGVADELQTRRPDVILNCAGKTGRPNIDWCEDHRLDTARANITGPLVLLEQCLRYGMRLVHIGSGCIFEGDNSGRGFSEEDPPNYFGSYYSRTKIAAEQILSEFPVLILRLRMPFDDTTHPRSLISRLCRYESILDAQNSVTYLPDFIHAAKKLIQRGASGIFHLVNRGTVSPYDMMVRYKMLVNPELRFDRLSPEQLATITKAGRSNCLLATDKLERMGLGLRPIDEAIDDAFKALRQHSHCVPRPKLSLNEPRRLPSGREE